MSMRSTKSQLLEAEGDLPRSWKQALAAAKGEELRRQWDEDERALRVEEEVNRADEAFGAALSALFRRWPEAATSLIERCAGSQGRRTLLEDWGAVAISDSAEDMEVLAGRLGEEFTEQQLNKLIEKAKTWAF